MDAFKKLLARGAKYTGACAAGTGAAYAIYAGATWLRYGRTRHAAGGDALLSRFMPAYEIVEQHSVHVNAPADVTFGAACETSLEDSAIIRRMFRVREMLMRSNASRPIAPHLLVEQMEALGWGLLAEIPGRELVFGAVTQPWIGDVVFRAPASEEFAGLQEPGFVKIAWNVRVDAQGGGSVSRTETRALATDAKARTRFRMYWSLVSLGVVSIRLLMLRLVKRQAERRSRGQAARLPAPHP